MELEEHADAAAFLAAAAPVLAADEARHNLIYGICSTLIDSPDAYPEAYLWTIGDPVVAAAVMTPPFNVVVAQPLDEEALPFAVRALYERLLRPPGVTGAIPEADVFADAWQEVAGAGKRLRMSQGIYAAKSVVAPVGVEGEPRTASVDDSEFVLEWLRAFQEEAMEEGAPHVDFEAAVERRLRSPTSGFVLWEDNSEPVSLCGYGGRTPRGVRIGPVYTPSDRRRHGYGSAVTAHVTKQQLDAGRDYCFLYTDITNPTSNRIYTNIGYELVCHSADYVFEW